MAEHPYRGREIGCVCHVWGELASHERLFNPSPQFSRLGTWCTPTLVLIALFVHSCVRVVGWFFFLLLFVG